MLMNEDGLDRSKTISTPWAPLKQEEIRDLNFSWPAVSQTHSLIFLSWRLIVLQRRSMVVMSSVCVRGLPEMKLWKMEVFPTSVSPMMMILQAISSRWWRFLSDSIRYSDDKQMDECLVNRNNASQQGDRTAIIQNQYISVIALSLSMKQKHKQKGSIADSEAITNQNQSKLNNFTLKELKIHVSSMNYHNDYDAENSIIAHQLPPYKLPASHPIYNRFKIKRNALNKLPQLHLQHHQEFEKRQPIPYHKNQANSTKKGSHMFVVNSLIEILKSEDQEMEIQQCKRSNHMRDDILKLKLEQQNYSNQFAELSINSTKNQRGPKIVETQINRFKPQNNIFRRKIVSEDKTRLKTEPSKSQQTEKIELLTFYNKFYSGKKEQVGKKVRLQDQSNEFNEFIY